MLTGVGETLAGRLLMVNAMSMEWTTMRSRTPGCEVCGGDH
jgi:molybdopterin/thiamine biosynthesis adenylyltransferase